MDRFKPSYNFLFLIFLLLTHNSLAQKLDTTTNRVNHTQAIDNRPNEPIRILSMRLPFRTSPIDAKHEITIDYRLGNVWNPSGVIEYQNPDEPIPEHPWEATYHPPYNEMPHRYQFYSADGVLRSSTINFTYKLHSTSQVFTAININELVSGDNPIDFLVSDKAIERFHLFLFGQNDPFRRVNNGFNRTQLKFTDRDGRVFEIKPKKIFIGTWDLGYQLFFEISRSKNHLWTASILMQAGIPLNRARQYLSAGTVASMSFTKQITKRYGLTIAGAFTFQNDEMISIRSKYYDPGYSKTTTGYRFLLGQNFDFESGRRFSIGVELQGMSRPLSTKQRVTAPYINPEDIGVQSSYTPEYWTPQNPVSITNQRRAGRSLIRGSEYISLNFSYRLKKQKQSPTLSVYLQEDWTIFYDTESISFPLFSISNNSQDFGFGIKLNKPF